MEEKTQTKLQLYISNVGNATTDIRKEIFSQIRLN